jgi:hypothetical protein
MPSSHTLPLPHSILLHTSLNFRYEKPFELKNFRLLVENTNKTPQNT